MRMQKSLLIAEWLELDTTAETLKEVISCCSSTKKQAENLENEAKILSDQYSRIKDKLQQVIGSFDNAQVDSISKARGWNNFRYAALRSVLSMATTLHKDKHLEKCNMGLLRRLEAIKMPGTEVADMELDWY